MATLDFFSYNKDDDNPDSLYIDLRDYDKSNYLTFDGQCRLSCFWDVVLKKQIDGEDIPPDFKIEVERLYKKEFNKVNRLVDYIYGED